MMEDEQTTPISARISLTLLSEIHKEIKDTGKSRSDFVEDAIKEKLFGESSSELLEKEIAYHESIVNNLKKKKQQHKEKEKVLSKIPEREISFLLETSKLLEENPTYCEGRINLYRNKFGKHYRISPNDFFELCYKAVDQNKEKQLMKELEAE